MILFNAISLYSAVCISWYGVSIMMYNMSLLYLNLKELLPYFPQLLRWAIQGHLGPLLWHLHLQINLCEGICIACNTLFKDHMYTCQWSDTGTPGPLVFLHSFLITGLQNIGKEQKRHNKNDFLAPLAKGHQGYCHWGSSTVRASIHPLIF